MTSISVRNICFAAALTLASQTAFHSAAQAQSIAQGINDAVTESAQIEDALRDIQVQSAANREGEVIDGEGGVFLLRKVDIFYVGADADVSYQSNPARTDAAGNDGGFVSSLSFFAGASTKIDNRFNVGVNLNANLTEVESASNISNRSAVLSAFASAGIFNEKVTLAVNGYMGTNTDKGFNSSSQFYGGSVSASTVIPLSQNIILRPVASVARQFSNNEEQNNWGLSARADGIWQMAPKWRGNLSLSYTHRIYDNFFENVTLIERNDDAFSINAGITHQLTPAADISMSANYTKQDSSFFLSSFEAKSISASARFVYRF